MKQPKALFLLFFVEMWECFSYYGMRVLLVLFMIEKLGFGDFRAYGIYALYTALVELGAIGGGYFADRVLGLRSTIFLGGAVITLGHLTLTLDSSLTLFFLGLGFVITGSCLFKSNIKALLGTFYGENDSHREAGFTLFYTGINVGGFMASLLCGFVGQKYGWHKGFGLAAIGMILGLIVLIACRNLLEDKGKAPQGVSLWIKVGSVLLVLFIPAVLALVLQKPGWFSPFLPLIGIGAFCYLGYRLKGADLMLRRAIKGLLGFVVLIIVYFAFEELTGSMMVVFCERHVNRHLYGFELPSSILVSINPLTIIIFGSLLARWKKGASINGVENGILKKSVLSFFFLFSAFFLLFSGSLREEGAMLSVVVPIVSFFLIALGELFMAPPIFSLCSQIAPKEMRGVLMAIVIMGFSYASLLSGMIGQGFALVQMVSQGRPDAIGQYGFFFGCAAGLALAIGAALGWLAWRRKSQLMSVKT